MTRNVIETCTRGTNYWTDRRIGLNTLTSLLYFRIYAVYRIFGGYASIARSKTTSSMYHVFLSFILSFMVVGVSICYTLDRSTV